jgi:glucosamine--fructose-6-phosphate aminotransferase (isomerizing)
MCGIIGVISKNKQELIPQAISALCDLEYRGYDSAGVGFIDEGKIKVYKCLGAPSEKLHKEDVYEKTNIIDKKITTVIGHNRWATHGKPSVKNAHPHVDCTGRIALAHNGTILNFESLKNSLEKLGHTFYSETDTEVIAHCIEEALKHEKDFRDAFVAAIKMLEGSFGIVAIDAQDPGKLYIAKNGSPLNIGRTKDAFIVASSVNALLRHTKEYIALSDNEYAVLNAQNGALKQEIFSLNKDFTLITKKSKQIKGVSQNDMTKGDFDTFMLKEIYEQPKTTHATLLGRYNKKTGDAVLGGIIELNEFFASLTNICTIACGTANNAGKVGKEIIEKMTNITVRNEIASEFNYKKINLEIEKTLMLAISQSGETADTLEAVKKAKRDGYTTCGIVNVVGSAISVETGVGEFTRAGTEIGVASTKAFTAQLALMYLFAIKLARARGTMDQKEGINTIKTLEKIPKLMQETLSLDKSIFDIAKKFKRVKNISFLGRGIHTAIADEAALKFKELTYLEAGSCPLGELKHGPIAVIDKDHLSVIIMPKDELFELSKNSVEQIRSKGGKVLIITDESARGESFLKKVDAVIFIPTIKQGIFYPLLEIIPLQLFAYHFATLLGRNVDKPRNLAKSVTVQ